MARMTAVSAERPAFGYCETCGAALYDLICDHCGEVYD